MAESQQRFQDQSIFEKAKIVQALAIFPAITIMVFIRRKVGFRMLKPTWLLVMAVILFAAAFFAPDATTQPHGWGLIVFAIAMLGLGTFQRWRRWSDLCSGVRWHTYAPGLSWLESLPLPGFLQSNRRIYRFVEPPLCALVGALIGLAVSHALGSWIMFAALALFIYEQALYEARLKSDLDILDGMFAAEVQAETVKHFEGPQPDQKQRTLEDTGGIPTGLAPDIHKQIEVRRAKRTAAVDNLAT